MAHPDWCGKVCAECRQTCWLDQVIPCSPDCPGLNNETGEPYLADCEQCDATYDSSGDQFPARGFLHFKTEED